ncbi:MAG: hypothetical protein P8008_00665 [Gammaproteobacteria bacterium]
MTDKAGSEPAADPRLRLIRQSAVFQLKLLVDGLRDFVLVPVSLVATLAGLLRSASDPEREFEQVLELGRRSERWINLFGTHDASDGPDDAGSIDGVLERVEQVLREQARSGDISGGAREALDATLASLRRRSGTAGPGSGSGGGGDKGQGGDGAAGSQ